MSIYNQKLCLFTIFAIFCVNSSLLVSWNKDESMMDRRIDKNCQLGSAGSLQKEVASFKTRHANGNTSFAINDMKMVIPEDGTGSVIFSETKSYSLQECSFNMSKDHCDSSFFYNNICSINIDTCDNFDSDKLIYVDDFKLEDGENSDLDKNKSPDTQYSVDVADTSWNGEDLEIYYVEDFLKVPPPTCNDSFNHEFTVVSGLFDLHRENWPHFQRTFDHYLNYSTQLLKMNVPLVAFVDPSSEWFVRLHRQHKMHITQIIVTSIEELDYYEDYDTIKSIMDSEEFQSNHAFINHPEAFSPEYNILMNSKPVMLYEAAQRNYFNSTHFFWIDMGYGHGNDVYPKDCDWAPRNLMSDENVGDKVTFIELNPIIWLSNIYEIYKKKVPPFLNGGFFGGSSKAVEKYYQVHKRMYKLLLLHRMTDDDQTIAIVCYFEDNDLFNLVDGWWYDAFELFH